MNEYDRNAGWRHPHSMRRESLLARARTSRDATSPPPAQLVGDRLQLVEMVTRPSARAHSNGPRVVVRQCGQASPVLSTSSGGYREPARALHGSIVLHLLFMCVDMACEGRCWSARRLTRRPPRVFRRGLCPVAMHLWLTLALYSHARTRESDS